MKEYELVVVGGGPGGYVAAMTGAQHGLKTLLIESDELGGTCLNRGCIPTKALLFCASRYYEATHSEMFGVRGKFDSFDCHAAYEHRRSTISRLRKGVVSLVQGSGGTILRGHACLCDANSVRVGEETIGFENLILATGSVPSPFPFPVSSDANIVNSDAFLALDDLPESCIVIGGGVIGLEFATILSRIGRKVVVVEAMERILANMDEELVQLVQREMKSQGVEFYTGTRVVQVQRDGKTTACEIQSADGKTVVLKAELVVGVVGRVANTSGLCTERIGLALRKGFVETDDRCATNVPHVYAIGDLNGYRMLAHAASYQGRKVAENIAQGTNKSVLDRYVPAAVYTDPELAMVGLTEKAACEKGYRVKVGKLQAVANGKMLTMGRRNGMVKIVSDSTTGEILGTHMALCHATDMISEMTLAMELEATVEEVAATIHPHPTVSEIIMDTAQQMVNRS